jgi:hypothetical protein
MPTIKSSADLTWLANSSRNLYRRRDELAFALAQQIR